MLVWYVLCYGPMFIHLCIWLGTGGLPDATSCRGTRDVVIHPANCYRCTAVAWFVRPRGLLLFLFLNTRASMSHHDGPARAKMTEQMSAWQVFSCMQAANVDGRHDCLTWCRMISAVIVGSWDTCVNIYQTMLAFDSMLSALRDNGQYDPTFLASNVTWLPSREFCEIEKLVVCYLTIVWCICKRKTMPKCKEKAFC